LSPDEHIPLPLVTATKKKPDKSALRENYGIVNLAGLDPQQAAEQHITYRIDIIAESLQIQAHERQKDLLWFFRA
jgi:hypothetical protein